MMSRCFSKLAILVFLLPLLASCSTLSYYSQSVVGHSRLMLARKPVDSVIQQVGQPLKAQLLLSKELRAFSVSELELPSSKSYTSYVDLKRDYPVWTVVAAPEFSLNAKQWCYPVIGCASYRGYFKESSAHAYASKLKAKGLEIAVGGAPAYSTLGWFADPLLPSMMRHGDTAFAETLFHEIAHQQLYVNGDSDFNEAFASVVGEIGVIRWLKHRPQDLADYKHSLKVQEQFYTLVLNSKQELNAIYESAIAPSEMRLAKERVLSDMQNRYEELKTNEWNGQAWYQSWFDGAANNAKFAGLSTYRDRVPELRALLTLCDESLPKFYNTLSAAKIHNSKVVTPNDCQ